MLEQKKVTVSLSNLTTEVNLTIKQKKINITKDKTPEDIDITVGSVWKQISITDDFEFTINNNSPTSETKKLKYEISGAIKQSDVLEISGLGSGQQIWVHIDWSKLKDESNITITVSLAQ